MKGKCIPKVVREKINALFHSGESIALLSERFGIPKTTLYKSKWVRDGKDKQNTAKY